VTIPIRNVYYLLCYAWRHAEQEDLVDADELDEFDAVHNLFGKVLARGTARLLRQGIDRGYRERTEAIPGVRGKIDVSGTAKQALRVRGQVLCTFEEMTPDVLHNRILRASLRTLLHLKELDPAIRREVGLVYRKLDGIGTTRLTRQHFRRVQLNSNMRLYRFLIGLCLLLYDSVQVDESDGAMRFLDFRRDDARMWQLFEDFVSGFYAIEQRQFRIAPSRRIAWHEPGGPDQDRIPTMTADLILVSPERRIILDTKFYRSSFGGRVGGKLHSQNLYQLLTYLQNRESGAGPGAAHEGVLLYPTIHEDIRVDVQLNGFWVRARSVDLANPWQEVREELLEVIGLGTAVTAGASH